MVLVRARQVAEIVDVELARVAVVLEVAAQRAADAGVARREPRAVGEQPRRAADRLRTDELPARGPHAFGRAIRGVDAAGRRVVAAPRADRDPRSVRAQRFVADDRMRGELVAL